LFLILILRMSVSWITRITIFTADIFPCMGVFFGDYPYQLDNPLTNDTALVAATINGYGLGSGSDTLKAIAE